ncbi:rhodanese-like domain-containing protein [uncultured Cytophaga sp.]|uniref:rhodanese-like domain-containing protein n=1 Tax=uncultured Cytophaga sp. TaxID=160238 RepID=UPI0026149707|nr:rhodanese-like domain-containing protein [uncultured Cytophaga sp.]
MIAAIKKILGIGPATDYKALMQKGAVIIDVRTKGEYAGGHIKGSLNIPVNEISNQLSKISKDKIIITCCASGMRSGSAKSMLKSKGYPEVYNGGPWNSLQRKIS